MVSARKVIGKRAAARFREAPWTENSPEWLAIDRKLPQDHLARAIVEAVKRLDLTPLWQSYSASGSAAYRPDLMAAIALYEMRRERVSPGQWYADMQEQDALLWIGFGIQPSRTCWYDFSRHIGPLLQELNAGLRGTAQAEGVTTAQRASLDGTAVAANASRHRMLKEATLRKRIGELEAVCAEDAAGRPATAMPSWMAKTPATRKRQAECFRRALERLQALQAKNQQQNPARRREAAKMVIGPADPEATPGRDKEKVFRPLYNVQLVVDLDSPFILGYEVFSQATDAGTLGPMLRGLSHAGGVPKEMLVDATYVTANNLARSAQAGTTLYGPWQENDFSKAKKQAKQASGKVSLLGKEAFRWDDQEKVYYCPQDKPLRHIGQEKRLESDGELHVVHRYRCASKDCLACAQQATCTTSPALGRSVRRSEHEDLVAAHLARMATDEAKALYKRRSQTVERAFGELKAHRGMRRMVGRGLERARTQVGLTVLAHNLLAVHRALQKRSDASEPMQNPREIQT